MRITFNRAKNFSLFDKMSSFLARFAAFALGNGRYAGLQNLSASHNDRRLRIHIGNDVAKRPVYPLFRRIER
ncbi:hypothetical protein D3C77_680950 [compost metagenome]